MVAGMSLFPDAHPTKTLGISLGGPVPQRKVEVRVLASTGLGSSATHLVLGPEGWHLALFPCWCRKEESLTTSGALTAAQRGDEEFFVPIPVLLAGCLGGVDISGLTPHRCGVVGSLTTQTGIQCSARTQFLTDVAWRIPRAVGATAPPPCGER